MVSSDDDSFEESFGVYWQALHLDEESDAMLDTIVSDEESDSMLDTTSVLSTKNVIELHVLGHASDDVTQWRPSASMKTLSAAARRKHELMCSMKNSAHALRRL